MDYNQRIRLILYRRRDIFDDLLITPNWIFNYKCKNNERPESDIIKFNKRGCDAYLASAYVTVMKLSQKFLSSTFCVLLKHCENKLPEKSNPNFVIFIKLLMPKHQFIDHKWNEKINIMLIERINIEYAMSWLSTLGGAFSALGDSFEHCAEIAGKISVRQFKLALQLGDPALVARCKLFAALSLIQRNYLKYPKVIIPQVFTFAKEINDVRLQRMSQGIWVKLRYYLYLRKQKKQNTNRNNQVK